jgi:23S rRNA pseudouridine1911/1915/1917 synthase
MENPFKIVVENEDFIIVNKSSGQLSQMNRPNDHSIEAILRKTISKKQFLHLLTRLDRPVSGCVVLAKSRSFNRYFLEQQDQEQIKKTYFAIVEGVELSDNTSLVHYLFHDKNIRKAYISEQPKPGYLQVDSNIQTLARFDRYSLISITIFSGKFHQIRAQLGFIGHPVKGDVKYGARRGNTDRSIHLHCYSIRFRYHKEDRNFFSPMPNTDQLWEISQKYAQ